MEFDLTRNWWALALRGVAAILFGVMAFIWPGITIGALVLLFGAYALVDGVFAVALAIVGRRRIYRWWALLLEGLVGIVVGILTFLWPGDMTLALVYLIAAWAVVTGVFEIAAAIELRKYIQGEWILAVTGVLSIAFGLLLFIAPAEGAVVMIWWIGGYAIVFGVLLLVLAFQVRSLARRGVARTPAL
jgi:uncharacterized membrane protein HdeD (DUF308 family)